MIWLVAVALAVFCALLIVRSILVYLATIGGNKQ